MFGEKKGNKHQNDQVQWIYTVAQIKKMIICLSVDEFFKQVTKLGVNVRNN